MERVIKMEDNFADKILKRKMERDVSAESKKFKTCADANTYEIFDVRKMSKTKMGKLGLFKNFLDKKSYHQLSLNALVDDPADDISTKGTGENELLQQEDRMITYPNALVGEVPHVPSSILNEFKSNDDMNDLRLISKLPVKVKSHNCDIGSVTTGSTSEIHRISNLPEDLKDQYGNVSFIFDKNMVYENRMVLKALHLYPFQSHNFQKMLSLITENDQREVEVSCTIGSKSTASNNDVKIMKNDEQYICKIKAPSNAIFERIANLSEFMPSFQAIASSEHIAIKFSNMKRGFSDGSAKLNDISFEEKETSSETSIKELSISDDGDDDDNELGIKELFSNQHDLEVDENGNYLTTCLNGDLHVKTDEDYNSGGMDDSEAEVEEHHEEVPTSRRERDLDDLRDEALLCARIKAVYLRDEDSEGEITIKPLFGSTSSFIGLEHPSKRMPSCMLNKQKKMPTRHDLNFPMDAESVTERKLTKVHFLSDHADVPDGFEKNVNSWEEQFQDLNQYSDRGATAPEIIAQSKSGIDFKGPLKSISHSDTPNDKKVLTDITNKDSIIGAIGANYNEEYVDCEDHVAPSEEANYIGCDYYPYYQCAKPIRVGISRKRKVSASLHPYLISRKKRLS